MVAIDRSTAKRVRAEVKAGINELERRARATSALGSEIDDLTYEQLRRAETFPAIFRIARAHDRLDLWSKSTLRFLHIASMPNVSERYFIRTLRALRNAVQDG